MSLKGKIILSLVIITAIITVYHLTSMPENEENIAEELSEIEWENINRIVINSKEGETILEKNASGWKNLSKESAQVSEDKIKNLIGYMESIRNSAEYKEANTLTGMKELSRIQLFDETEELIDLITLLHGEDRLVRFSDSPLLYSVDTSKLDLNF